MIWWFVVIGVLVVVFGLVIFQDRPVKKPETVSPEAAMQAAVELHRIRRRLDVAHIKTEQRRDSSRLRREIGEVLDGDDPT